MIWGVAIAYNLFFLPDLLLMLCFPSCLYFSSTSALSDHLQSNYRPANYSGIKPATISDQNEKHHLERKIWILFFFFFFFSFYNHCLYHYVATSVPGFHLASTFCRTGCNGSTQTLSGN